MGNFINANYAVSIREKLEREHAKTSAFLAAWEAVTYNTKKDGTPFANVQKNINGASVSQSACSLYSGRNDLTVYTRAEKCGYIHNSIQLYKYIPGVYDKSRAEEREKLLPRADSNGVYNLNIDEIKREINERVNYLKARKYALESEIKRCESEYITYITAIQNATRELYARNPGGELTNELLHFVEKNLSIIGYNIESGK